MRILFLLKERFYSKNTNSYGLINSSRHVADYLERIGHECKIVQVVDGNSIDAEVFKFKPDSVIIEALWVSGAKLKELIEIPRYKDISWVIRIHSDIGFLSAETLALKYVNDYIELEKPNLFVSTNTPKFNKYLSEAMSYDFLYLPNIIKLSPLDMPDDIHEHKKHIDIGCFGSLRILKNQCYQAMCAMTMADRLGKQLKFHITVDVGMNEANSRWPVLTNLEEMFSNSSHELVKHEWKSNHDFQHLISKMDMGLQLSYTESFNIVAADFVNNGVPIVVSDAIYWMPFILKASTTDYDKTINKMMMIYHHRDLTMLIRWMKRNLRVYNQDAKREWEAFYPGEEDGDWQPIVTTTTAEPTTTTVAKTTTTTTKKHGNSDNDHGNSGKQNGQSEPIHLIKVRR
jgi:hypothetical protein